MKYVGFERNERVASWVGSSLLYMKTVDKKSS